MILHPSFIQYFQQQSSKDMVKRDASKSKGEIGGRGGGAGGGSSDIADEIHKSMAISEGNSRALCGSNFICCVEMPVIASIQTQNNTIFPLYRNVIAESYWLKYEENCLYEQ